MAAGADGLEFDVHLSADGVVVVHHDVTLDRTTDARGPIARRSADELSRVDAAYRFAPERGYPDRGRGAAVPTLRQVLERYSSARIIVEMKVDTTAMGIAVADEVQRAEAVERVCLAGAGARALAAARLRLPRAASSAGAREVRFAVYRSWLGFPVSRARYGGYQVPESAQGHRIVSPRFIARAHRAGMKVQVWTVDDERDMRRLLEWGADALISNRPDLAVRVRDEFVRRETLRT